MEKCNHSFFFSQTKTRTDDMNNWNNRQESIPSNSYDKSTDGNFFLSSRIGKANGWIEKRLFNANSNQCFQLKTS